jgi:hypothetical protein
MISRIEHQTARDSTVGREKPLGARSTQPVFPWSGTIFAHL